MTHADLLSEIDHDINNANGLSVPGLRALRAVVELHRPDVRGNCDICSWVSGGFVIYSVCPTIKSIEAVISNGR